MLFRSEVTDPVNEEKGVARDRMIRRLAAERHRAGLGALGVTNTGASFLGGRLTGLTGGGSALGGR